MCSWLEHALEAVKRCPAPPAPHDAWKQQGLRLASGAPCCVLAHWSQAARAGALSYGRGQERYHDLVPLEALEGKQQQQGHQRHRQHPQSQRQASKPQKRAHRDSGLQQRQRRQPRPELREEAVLRVLEPIRPFLQTAFVADPALDHTVHDAQLDALDAQHEATFEMQHKALTSGGMPH